MANPIITRIQVEGNDVVSFLNGTTPPYTYVRSMSQILPQSPTYISYRYDSITISQVGGEAFTFTVYTITQVGGNSFTALNFQDPATTVQAKTVEIYRLLVTSIFKGCCECGNTEPECSIQYTYGNSGFTGEFDYTYGTPGLIRFNDITGNNQNFSGFFPLIPDGSWVFLFSKTDPTVYAVLQLSNYSSGGGSAGFDAIELNAAGTPFVEGTQFCVDFTSVGGSLVQGWQDTLNINPNLNQDNTIDGGGFDFVFDNNNSFTINGPGGSFEVDAFGPAMNAGTQQILVTAGYIDINTPLIGSASPGWVLSLTASGHVEYAPAATGTVVSVGVSAGTGISASVANPTTTPVITITNTAPDQIVSISGGTGISTSGTYPNFTITNTAPDQLVSITAGSNINVTGTYPNFTIAATSGGGTVTSVGLSVPTPVNPAFSVSGSPVISSGTLTISANGTSAQYIDGTGALQTFPAIEIYDGNQGIYKDTSGANDTFMLGAPLGGENAIAFTIDRYISTATKQLNLSGTTNGSSTAAPVRIVNSYTGTNQAYALSLQSGANSGSFGAVLKIAAIAGGPYGIICDTVSGTGIYLTATSGRGIETRSYTNQGLVSLSTSTAPSIASIDATKQGQSSSNDDVLAISKTSTTAGSAGIKGSIAFYNGSANSGLQAIIAGRISYSLTDTTNGSQDGKYHVSVVENDVDITRMEISSPGQLTLNAYTTSTAFASVSGPSVGILNVDSSGNVFVGTGGTSSPLTTKGDLYTYSTTNDRLPVGTNGQVLTADSTTATGLKWDTPTTGGGLKSGTATQVSPGVYETTISGVTSLAAGDTFIIKFDSVNEGASTLEINTLTPYDIFKNTNVKISSGDIKANQEITVVFDGTAFQAIGLVSSQLLAYVHNEEGAVITKGQVVYAYQASGDKMSVKLARADSDATSAKTVGLVYDSSIGIGGEGYIIIQGVIEGINTSAFSAGNTLYLSGTTFGGLTATKPYAPIHLVYVGIVEKANAGNGQIYVRCQNGYEMDELHDVASVGAVNNDILYRDTTVTPNLWKPASIPTILGYTPVPTTRSISTTSPLTGGGDLSADRTISIPAATSSVNGYLTSTDWTNFNTAYTNRITSFTTNNTSGNATLSSNTLNIPNYSLNDLGRIAVSTANAREDDYAPSGWPGTSDRVKVIAIDSTNTNYMMSLGGLASPVAGRVVTIVNNSTANNLIIIENLSTSSTAANRFRMTNNMAYFLLPTRSVTFIYDGTYWTQMSASLPMGMDLFNDCTDGPTAFVTGTSSNMSGLGVYGSGTASGVRAEGDSFGALNFATGSNAARWAYANINSRKGGGNTAFAVNSTFPYLTVGRVLLIQTGTAAQDFIAQFSINGNNGLAGPTSSTPPINLIGYAWYYGGSASGFWDNRSQNSAGTISTVASPLAATASTWVNLGIYKPGGSNIRDAVYFYSTDGVTYQVSSKFVGTASTYGGTTTVGLLSTAGTTSKEMRLDFYGVSFNLSR